MKLSQSPSASKNIFAQVQSAVPTKLTLSFLGMLALAGCVTIVPNDPRLSELQRQNAALQQRNAELEDGKKQTSGTIVITEKDVTVTPAPTATPKPVESLEKPTIIEKDFVLGENGKLDALNLRGIFGDITVEIIPDEQQPTMRFRGDHRLAQITVTAGAHTTIRAPQKNVTTYGGVLYITDGNSNTNIGGITIINGVVQGGLKKEDILLFEAVPTTFLKVHAKTALDLGVYGNGSELKVPAMQSDTHLDVSAGADARVEATKALNADVSSGAMLDVKTMDGDLDLDLSSGAQASVHEGMSPTARLDLSSGALAYIHSLITKLFVVDASSGAEVRAPRVTGTKQVDTSSGATVSYN